MKWSRWIGVGYATLAVVAVALFCAGTALGDQSLKMFGKYALLAAVIVGSAPLVGFALYSVYERVRTRL